MGLKKKKKKCNERGNLVVVNWRCQHVINLRLVISKTGFLVKNVIDSLILQINNDVIRNEF